MLVRRLASAVAAEFGWQDDWLNDAVKGFVVGPATLTLLFGSPGIRASRPTYHQLLAMKLCAWRDDVDVADARRILRDVVGSRNEVWVAIQPHLRPAARWQRGTHSRTSGRRPAVGVEAIARAVVAGDALAARSLAQDWLAADPRLSDEPPPSSPDARVRAVSAALAELFADRLGQAAPAWAAGIGPLDEPFYLLASARTMLRSRRLCEEQTPPALRRRRLYAPGNYLTFA